MSSSLHLKLWKVLDFVFFGGDIKSGVIFRPFWPRLPVPGPRPLHGIFDSSFYWELGKNLHF